MKFKDSFHPYAMTTIIFWSLAYALTRLTLHYFSPFSLSFMRYFTASLALVIVAAVTRMKPPKKADIPLFLVSGFVGFFFYMIGFNKGQVTVSAATASVVIATVPVITALLALVIYKEKLRRFQWIAIAIEFAGVAVLTLLDGVLSFDVGILWLFAAAIALSVYNLIIRKLANSYSALQSSAYSIFFGTVMLAVFLPGAVKDASQAPPIQFLYILILGVCSSAVAYVCWAKALTKAKKASQVSNYMFITPFLSSAFGFLLAGEVPGRATLFGGAIIIIGVFIFNFGDGFLKSRTRPRNSVPQTIQNVNTDGRHIFATERTEEMTELQEKIISLKKESDTLILAHYYQPLEIQDIADHVGDSFALAKIAQDAGQESLILCGVRFMAESAKILNPRKKVFLPAEDAGCPMADTITPEDVLALRAKYPLAAVVCYVNSSAAVKAVCDICCTSSSAVKIVSGLTEKQIIFVPDKNLGAYVAEKAPKKEFILFEGCCPIHDEVTHREVLAVKNAHPNAKLLAHPECPSEVLALADYIGSTAGILDYAQNTDAKELIIGTERGVMEILCRKLPDKKIILAKTDFICKDMKKTSLEDVLACLEGKRTPLFMTDEEIALASKSLERMVAMG